MTIERVIGMAEAKAIRSFTGKYGFLSNFYASEVSLDGETYPTVEHAFQAAKTLDPEERRRFREHVSPTTAKARGRKLQLRPDWELIKVEIMKQLVEEKFSPKMGGEESTQLAEKLLATGNKPLEEGNRHGDRFWGTVNGEGQNMLGKILMSTRKKLQEGTLE